MIGYSLLNPVRFKFDMDYNFDHNVPYCYFQKWQEGDEINIQVLSDGPVHLDLRDQKTLRKIQTFDAVQIPSNLQNVDFSVWEFSISEIPYSGFFFFELWADNMDSRYYSYPFKWEPVSLGTILFQYRNSYNDLDVIFETGIEYNFRVEGTVQNFTPKSDSTVYFDQKKDPQQLSANPYRTWSLIIGTGLGVPDWSLDLMNHIMSVDTKKVDNLNFERNEGAEWEIQRVDQYGLSAASIEIVQKSGWQDGFHRDLTILADSENFGITLNNSFILQ